MTGHSPSQSACPASGSPSPETLESVLDGGGWNPARRRVIGLAASAVILDGLDNQILGFIVPSLTLEWGVDRFAFVPIIAASLLAMSVGTALAGRMGDRFGRRPTLIGCVALFGIATLLSSASSGLISLALFRMIAALGLGGAMPNATAMLAEYSMKRHRSTIVTLGIVCVPLGGLLAGVIASAVLPGLGWRALLMIGGMLPLLAAVLMALLLPESPSFLATRLERRGDLDKVLKHYGVKSSAIRFAENATGGAQATGSIFDPALRRDTIVLWGIFFFCLLAVYSIFNWAPTMLAQAGYGIAAASAGLAAFNLGGVVGALLAAFLIDRLGSRTPMMLMAGGGAATSFLGAWAITHGVQPLGMQAIFVANGACIAGLQVVLFALAAGMYPADCRATGVGAALAIGRLGAVCSSAAGAVMLALSADRFLLFVGASMLVTGLTLGVLRRHLPRRAAGARQLAT